LSEAEEEELPLFVSVPTESQVMQTRAFITQQAAKVAALQAKYLEQKQISDALESKLKAAQQLLFETQATIATVSRVPPEILSIIFTVHVEENKESPWLLMQVSRAWRAAALGTRRIWGRIILAPSNWNKSKKGSPRVRIWDGMEVCYKQAQLIRALKRAGAAPLDLKIVFTHSTQRRRWRPGMTDAEHDLLFLVNSIPLHQQSPRLRSLNIWSDATLTLPAKTFHDFNFTDLVSLTLDEKYPEVVDQVVKEARGLRSLKVQAQSLEKLEGCKWWDQVEELDIRNVRYAKDPVVRSILCAATALTSLRLEHGKVSDANSLHEKIHLPLLKRLELTSITDFWPIDCPGLTYLGLHSPSTISGLQAASIHLPYLTELSFSGSHTYEDPLSVFDFPSLNTFELRCAWGRSTSAAILKRIWDNSTSSTLTKKSSSSRIEPTIFRIQDTIVNPKVLARALTGRTLLRELYTANMQITAEFFDALAPVRKETKKSQTSKGGRSVWQIGCPALKILVVDHVGRKVKQEQSTMEASAKALVAARIKAGAPLERFAIRFSKDEGWKEFIDTDA
jgi:hypothetical protein